MQRVESRLTVFFDDPFWVGVYERIWEGGLEVCKVTFGAEPRDYEVYAFLLENRQALRFSLPVRTDEQPHTIINPKRMQRAIKKQLGAQGAGTRSQQALQAQREEHKARQKTKTREQKDAEKQRAFELRQQKRKEKHRGH